MTSASCEVRRCGPHRRLSAELMTVIARLHEQTNLDLRFHQKTFCAKKKSLFSTFHRFARYMSLYPPPPLVAALRNATPTPTNTTPTARSALLCLIFPWSLGPICPPHTTPGTV